MKKRTIFVSTTLILMITMLSCGENIHVDVSPCEQAFFHNRNVDITTSKVPYMKTCGLSRNTSKFLHDVYARDMNVDQSFVNAIYDEFEITDKLLSESKIPYYAIGGTLIGAIRNGGLIPNDDDMDIALDIAYEPKLLALTNRFEEAGYELTKADFLGYKVYKKNFRTNGLDIFLTTVRSIKGTDVMAFAREGAFNTWPHEWLPISALKNLTRISFGHLTISSLSINDAVDYLDRAYGNDWYTITYKTYDHVNMKAINSTKMKLLPTEYYHLVHSKTLSSKP